MGMFMGMRWISYRFFKETLALRIDRGNSIALIEIDGPYRSKNSMGGSFHGKLCECHNQMVNLHFPMVFLWFSYGFPMVFLLKPPFSWENLWFSYGKAMGIAGIHHGNSSGW